MMTSAANRLDPQKLAGNRLGNRGASELLPPGLDLTQIVSGMRENWDDIERLMPWYQPPQSEREGVRQRVVQETPAVRPQSKEEKFKDPTAPISEGEEGLLGEKPAVSPAKVVKEQQATPVTEKTAEKGGEATAQAALNWRAPEMPKVEGQAVPASFAVPNHSAGASGFGNTWSHAAAPKQGSDSIILSE